MLMVARSDAAVAVATVAAAPLPVMPVLVPAADAPGAVIVI